MKFALLSLVVITSGLFIQSTAFASDIPVVDANQADVSNIRLETHPETNSTSLMATVRYEVGCTPSTSIVVSRESRNEYKVLLTRARLAPGIATCMMIGYGNKEVEITQIGGPIPDGITVNGQGLGQQK